MSTFHFTTVASDPYITRAIVLYDSLMRCCKDFRLFILCVEEDSLSILREMDLPNVTLISLGEVEDEALVKAKANRSYHEYYWTLKPAALYHVMQNYPDAKYYAYMDSDLYFFSDPAQIFEERPDASLFLIDHNNSKRFLFSYNLFGRYNTGFVGCRNDSNAAAAVVWWRARCIEHCSVYLNVVEKTFGDQRYVERWPLLFKGVHIVKSVGADVAIWNIEKLNIAYKDGKLFADRDKLIFYHFSGLAMYSMSEFNLTSFFHIKSQIVNMIYLPYMIQLNQLSQELYAQYPDFNFGFKSKEKTAPKHFYKL